MTVPAYVSIVGQLFAVHVVDPDDKHLAKDKPDMPNLGTCRIVDQAIYIREGMGPDQERDTLLHELVHGCLRVVGVAISDEDEERVAAALAPVWLDLFRRNPALVSYLVTA